MAENADDSCGNGGDEPPAAAPNKRIPADEIQLSDDAFASILKSQHEEDEKGAQTLADVMLASETPPPKEKTTGLLGIDDILSADPYETEAEAQILKAVEQRRRQSTADYNLGKNMSAVFSKDPSLLQVTDQNRDTSTKVHFDEDVKAAPKASGHKRVPTKTGLQGHRHRKTASVEDTLFDMTAAMVALNNEEISEEEGDEDSLSIQEELLPKEPHHTSANSGELLLRTARILFRRNMKEESTDINSSQPQTKASKNWSKLKDAYIDKKTDGDDIQETEPSSQPQTEKENSKPVDVEIGGQIPPAQGSPTGRRRRWGADLVVSKAREVQDELELISDFFKPKKSGFLAFLRRLLIFLILPALCVAAILFYAAGNPPTGTRTKRAQGVSFDTASASWMVLFICVRQAVTFTIALFSQVIFVDYLSLKSRVTVRVFGPAFALLVAQSRGWPFVLFSWAITDFIMLSGGRRFSRHWLYWQTSIDMFNENNPSGTVVESEWNIRILTAAVVVGVVVALKRQYVGFVVSRRTFLNYGDQLAKIARKVILIGEVATLAKKLASPQRYRKVKPTVRLMLDYSREATEASSRHLGDNPYEAVQPDPERKFLMEGLGRWEEPDRHKRRAMENFSLSSIFRFRQTLELFETQYPLSIAYGRAATREESIDSAEKVYKRLLLGSPGSEILGFETIARVAGDLEGDTLDNDKVKELLRLFRPDAKGKLSLLDFVKSTDMVYKDLRLLQASIDASSRIDYAFEKIFNIGFYAILGSVVLSLLGFNPVTLFLSLSGIIVSFAFIVGQASSKLFEGILFILVRRPYDIGDRIHVSNPDNDTSPNGSSGWIVDDIGLFSTTLHFGTTNEVATLSNGSLANSRIINMARSPQAVVYIYFKFGVAVPYEKIKLFKTVVEQFVLDRPREWLSFCGFRATRVEADLGFVEYVIVLQHREAWQYIVSILDSKAKVSSFGLEVTKKMNMGYKSPPLPIDLKTSLPFDMKQTGGLATTNESGGSILHRDPYAMPAMDSISDLFRDSK